MDGGRTVSGYVYWINAAAPVAGLAIADAIGSLIGSEPGDVHAFTTGVKLRAIGDATNTVVARGVSLPVKVAARDAVVEFLGEGPYPNLTAAGASPELIVAAKAAVSVETGARADLEANALAFWASLGWEPVRGTL